MLIVFRENKINPEIVKRYVLNDITDYDDLYALEIHDKVDNEYYSVMYKDEILYDGALNIADISWSKLSEAMREIESFYSENGGVVKITPETITTHERLFRDNKHEEVIGEERVRDFLQQHLGKISHLAYW